MNAYIYLYGRKGATISKHTTAAYRRGVLDLLEAWNGKSLIRPRRDVGALYIRSLERQYQPATVKLRLTACRRFYAALRWTGVTEATPFLNVHAASDPTPTWEKREAYSQYEIKKLLAEATLDLQVMILLGAHAGLRVSEMVSLTWENVDMVNRHMSIIGKGGKRATVPMSRSLHDVLEQMGQREGWVLPFRNRHTAKVRLQRLCRRAQVRSLGVHALRHSAGTRLRQQGSDIADIADHLRHSNITTARGYAKAHNTAKALVEEW